MSILKNKTEGAIEVSRDSGEKGKGKSGSKPAIVVVFICEREPQGTNGSSARELLRMAQDSSGS